MFHHFYVMKTLYTKLIINKNIKHLPQYKQPSYHSIINLSFCNVVVFDNS